MEIEQCSRVLKLLAKVNNQTGESITVDSKGERIRTAEEDDPDYRNLIHIVGSGFSAR